MIKENRFLYLRCLVAFILQFLSFIYKPLVFVELIYLMVLIIADKVENKICYLFFMLPFYNVFRYGTESLQYNNILDNFKSLYLSVLLVLTFCGVMFVKYIIDIKNKQKSFKWKKVLIWALFYFVLILPIKTFNIEEISSLATITALFVSLYFVLEYKNNFNLKTILDVWLVGLILSVAVFFFKGLLPNLNQYIIMFEKRFSGLHRDPNYFAFEALTLLC